MDFETVIGLETHAELATETKLFCGCSTRFGSEANTQTCPVCLGLPGVLPVINRKAFEMALKAALAFECEIAPETRFDRKNYYYPDLPKNYQISQNYNNLGVNGHLDIDIDGETRRVRIHNVHLEEDAGKSIHPEESDANYTLVDLNRTGIPLLEIVTEPDMRTAGEVEAFMQTLRNTLIYLGASECKMQEGQLRFEASVSLRPRGANALGSRVEIKNLNSMKAVLAVVEHEIERQREILSRGDAVARETRLWNELAGRSERMRSKEEAQDYRYFPEPDLVPIDIDAAWLGRLRNELPELPTVRRRRFIDDMGLSEYDAGVLTEDKGLADYFEATLAECNAPKSVANWVSNHVLREINERQMAVAEFPVRPKQLAELIKTVEQGTINMNTARDVLAQMIESRRSAAEIIRAQGLAQISDADELESVVDDVLASNCKAAEDFRKGKKNVLGFLVGQVMRQTKGKANPKLVNDLLQKKLRS